MVEEKQDDIDAPLKEDESNTINDDLQQSNDDKPNDVVAQELAQEVIGSPTIEEPRKVMIQGTVDASPTAPESIENTQEPKTDSPTKEKSMVQDELTVTAQELLTKEETLSDEESQELVVTLPTSDIVEQDYITELPTAQEEVAAPQEFTKIIANESSPSNQEIIEEEEVLDREEILARCREALSEQEKLKTQNQHLQHKLAEYLARKKMDDRIDASNKSFGDQEQRYMKSLNELETLQNSYTVLLNEYLQQEKELSDQCSEKQTLVEQAYEECKQYKLDNSCTAVYSRTGKWITKQEIEQLEASQKKKETGLIAVRLDNIKLQYKVQKCETQLKQKEELAEGLHMIDFEQLKIDNVSLNEKIEERNEDIIKLKKKITNAVQVLTHLKQKLQFVQVENCGKKERLKQIENVVAQKRDLLTRTKQTRDALRINNNALRHKGGLVSHSTLLRDFEERKDQNEMLQEQLIDLQNRHSSLILTCDGLRKKLEQAKLVQS